VLESYVGSVRGTVRISRTIRKHHDTTQFGTRRDAADFFFNHKHILYHIYHNIFFNHRYILLVSYIYSHTLHTYKRTGVNRVSESLRRSVQSVGKSDVILKQRLFCMVSYIYSHTLHTYTCTRVCRVPESLRRSVQGARKSDVFCCESHVDKETHKDEQNRRYFGTKRFLHIAECAECQKVWCIREQWLFFVGLFCKRDLQF